MGVKLLSEMRLATTTEPEVRPALGKHFYQFYKGREDLFRIVIPFLRSGLEGGEACLWVVSSSVGILEAVEAFQRCCDLVTYIDSGQLSILPAERWYLERGRFSQRKVLDRFKRLLGEKRRKGFRTLRGVYDIGWLDGKDWEKFQGYEDSMDEWLEAAKMIGLCTYPIQQCSLTQTKDVLEHHDSVFLSKL